MFFKKILGRKKLLDLEGPYDLDLETVNKVVKLAAAGNYALGYTNEAKKEFVVRYIGRADKFLNDELQEWLKGGEPEYPEFKASYAPNAKVAFEKHCENYHDFGGAEELDNEGHPEQPKGTNYRCPRCDIFG